MRTDRSLWVEDKYALRCRGCAEKFTVFRRRHHCRRCGQVFCYECLKPPPTEASVPQSIIFNVYQWLAPTLATPISTRTSAEVPKTTGKCNAVSSSRDGASVAAVAAAAAAAELSMLLCCRCAATVAKNASREASAPHAEFPASSLTGNSAAQSLSNVPSPLMLSVPLPCLSSPKLETPIRLDGRSPPEEALSPTPLRTLPAIEMARQLAASDSSNIVAPESVGCTGTHAETEEEREVTYSIGRVWRPPPSIMAQWWVAHQQALKDRAARTFPGQQTSPCASTLESAGALVRTLSDDPVSFDVRFFLGADMTQLALDSKGCVLGSATVIAMADAPASLHGFLSDFGAACTTHLKARIQHTLQVYFPNTHGSRLCRHLADVAWHIVHHTAVALGASVFDHLSIFSILSPAQPVQCIVYPGLVNRRPHPSKRVMSPCDHPRVLLLAGDLSYPVQPAEDLVDYVHSYSGYLDKLFQRLVMWQPDVIVVEGNMHHYLRARIEAEDQMRLVLDVGREFLVQLSWCLHADIIADLQYVGVGDLATTAPLGHCACFEVLELAEEVCCCSFRGFDALSFHTLILRGERQWEAMEQVVREAVAVAYHLALQANGAAALVRKGLSISVSSATATAEEAAAAAAITMNVGCQFPSSVQSACRNAASPAALSTLKDNIVVNIVHMDHLFEGGTGGGSGAGNSVNGRSAVAVASAVMSTLAKSRSSELPIERGASRGPVTRFQASSHLDLPASSADTASPSAPLLGPPLGRAEAPAANAYAVVQQKSVLTFYGAGDERLFHFLVNRCAGTESQVLYLHGAHRVKVTTSTSASLPSAAATLTDSGLAGTLGAAQMLAFHKVTAQQSAARALTAAEPLDTYAIAAFVAHLRGYFSLRIRVVNEDVRVAAADAATVPAAPVDAMIDVCTPHLLNLSTAAFLEWVLYGWIPALSRHSAQSGLQLHFQFHSLGTAAQQQRQPSPANISAYPNTVTFLMERVPLSRIEYPPPVMPRAIPALEAKGSSEEHPIGIEDYLYAGSDADEMEGLLAELQQATRASLDRTEQLENTQADVLTAESPISTASSAVEAEGKASAAARTSSMPTGEGASSDLGQLCEAVQHALSALHDARQRGQLDVALLLANMRRHLLPDLFAAYRGWYVAQRKAGAKGATSTSTDASAAAGPECPSSLHRLDGCLYHKERSQWIRLAEPSSILAAALLHFYRPVPPSTSCTPSSTKDAAAGMELELVKSVSSEAAVAVPTTHHLSFAADSTLTTSSLNMNSATRSEKLQPLSMIGQLSLEEALEVLRQSSRADAVSSTSLKWTLSGYQCVVHPGVGGPAGLAGGAVATISSAASVASMIGGGTSNADPIITVDVLFPRSFAALHVLYTDGAPFDICAALVRCRPFSTDGGKSHSRFFVTHDGRFLIKSVKPMELRHFREWAPRYFARMADYYASLQQQQQHPSHSSGGEASAPLLDAQTTLGKIMGLYAVQVQGSRSRAAAPPTTSTSSVPGDTTPQLQNLLTDGTHCFMVSEQLLFQRPVREKWDLKGSQRNRTTEQTAAVRLDVDFVQERLRLGNFFFCTPEVKRLLMEHLSHDTALLAESGIMDYSLMASVGDGSVCVGIIDYLHPYSSAKVLESKVKSGLDTMLGYTRHDPTIIDPASYAARFMRWMDGYFNGVPDRLDPLTHVQQLKERRESGLVQKRYHFSPLSRETGKR